MITSIQNETIKKIMKLKQKKYRDLEDQFLIEGYHLVEEAKKANCIETIITTLHETFEEPTIYVSSNVMEKLAFTKTPQPIMAICHKPHHRLFNTNHQRYLLLDNIQDPGNLGTIVRTADAAGFDAVILGTGTVDLYNDKVLRSMQGSHFHIPVFQADLKDYLPMLKDKGVQVAVTALHRDSKDYTILQGSTDVAIVVGNEGQGVSDAVIDLADVVVTIPMFGKAESLNVAIASALLMYKTKEMKE